ncbi:MAG: hypothetical protein ABI577_18630 [bacterium]
MRVLIAGFALIWSVAVACDPNEGVVGETATSIANSPTPEPTSISKLLPRERDPHEVVAERSKTDPGLKTLVELVEAGRFDGVFAQIPQRTARCETILTREGNVCDFYGLQPGVDTQWSLAESLQPGRIPLKRQQADFEKLVAGRSASLELIAIQDSSRYYLIFALSPRSLTQVPLAVTVVFEPNAASPVLRVDDAGGYGGPPLEFIRFDEHSKSHTYEVLAAADSFHERELAWKQELLRSNTAFPPDYN